MVIIKSHQPASVQEKVLAYSTNKVNINEFENDISENTYERTPLIGNGENSNGNIIDYDTGYVYAKDLGKG